MHILVVITVKALRKFERIELLDTIFCRKLFPLSFSSLLSVSFDVASSRYSSDDVTVMLRPRGSNSELSTNLAHDVNGFRFEECDKCGTMDNQS